MKWLIYFAGLNMGLFLGALLSQLSPAPKMTVWASGIGALAGFVLTVALSG